MRDSSRRPTGRPRSPADEQRTNELPRPAAQPAAQSPPSEPTSYQQQRHAAPYTQPPDNQETTMLPRRGAPPDMPQQANIPGANRRPTQPTPSEQPTSVLPPYREPIEAYHRPAPPPLPERRDWDDRHTSTDATPPTEYPYDDHAHGQTDYRLDASEPYDPDSYEPAGLDHKPRKLTVTRVAALRSRELTHRGLTKFHGAVSADGADLSGLAHLTYAHMGNYAVDAALAVALANTLFFAAATAESTGKVLLYLLLTVAPFAVVAPLIGPALDKLQHGRRFALAASSFGRAALAVVMAINFESWVIYPCALGMLVLSKSFGVLKAALTPRVLPASITLVKTNSRLSVFGLIAGGASGAIAAGISAIIGSAGALGFTAACGLIGGWLCLRIPSWVESTAGEVPIHHSGRMARPETAPLPGAKRAMPRTVAAALWTNGTIRVETGFLALFIAFVIKTHYEPATASAVGDATATPSDNNGWMQLILLGAVGAAAGLGGFLGNALGARLPLRAPGAVALTCMFSVIATVACAFFFPGLALATIVALVGATASALAKVCLDSAIQETLPEASRASAFGRSESVLQMSWVFGGVLGLLIGGVWGLTGETVYMVGFGILVLFMLFGAAQAVAVTTGRSLLPSLPHKRLATVGGNRSRKASHPQ